MRNISVAWGQSVVTDRLPVHRDRTVPTTADFMRQLKERVLFVATPPQPRANEPHTCDRCRHYTSPSAEDQALGEYWRYAGQCGLMKKWIQANKGCPIDGIVGESGSNNFAQVDVGPKFGCIHWEQKT